MGDINQLSFVKRHLPDLQGPFLEVGSRDYGSTQDLRSLCSDGELYVGIDMQSGAGVDVTLDLTSDFGDVDDRLDGKRFGTVFCLSVLEHCDQPFRMADNISQLLAPGGSACIVVPFAWKFHGYPSDYWRFTHEGVRKLFPDLDFDAVSGAAASDQVDDFQELDPELARLRLSFSFHWKRRAYLRAFSSQILKLMGASSMFRWFSGHPYVLAPTSVMMIGRKPVRQSRAA